MNGPTKIMAGLGGGAILLWVCLKIAFLFSDLAQTMAFDLGLKGAGAAVWYAGFAVALPAEVAVAWWGQKKARERSAHSALMKFREGWLSDEAAENADDEGRAGRR